MATLASLLTFAMLSVSFRLISISLSLSAMRRLSFSCLRLVFSLCVFLPFSCLSALIRLSFSILLCLLSLSLSSTFPNHPFPYLLKTTTSSFRIHPDLSFSLSRRNMWTYGHVLIPNHAVPPSARPLDGTSAYLHARLPPGKRLHAVKSLRALSQPSPCLDFAVHCATRRSLGS